MDEQMKETLLELIGKFLRDNKVLSPETETLLHQITDVINADTERITETLSKYDHYFDQEQQEQGMSAKADSITGARDSQQDTPEEKEKTAAQGHNEPSKQNGMREQRKVL